MDWVTFIALSFKGMKAAEIMHIEITVFIEFICIYSVLLYLTTGKNVIAAGPSEKYNE